MTRTQARRRRKSKLRRQPRRGLRKKKPRMRPSRNKRKKRFALPPYLALTLIGPLMGQEKDDLHYRIAMQRKQEVDDKINHWVK